MKYSHTIRSFEHNGATIEIKRDDVAVFYAIYKDGAKVTDFMNCKGKLATSSTRSKGRNPARMRGSSRKAATDETKISERN
jgi:hypothetical protein